MNSSCSLTIAIGERHQPLPALQASKRPQDLSRVYLAARAVKFERKATRSTLLRTLPAISYNQILERKAKAFNRRGFSDPQVYVAHKQLLPPIHQSRPSLWANTDLEAMKSPLKPWSGRPTERTEEKA